MEVLILFKIVNFKKLEVFWKNLKITGREKMIDQFKIVQQGYILKYIFNVDKEIVSKIDKVTIELLNANKVLEVVAEYFPKTKLSIPEGSYAILSKGYFSGESKIIINKGDYIKGDRKYLYIFKITLESKDEKLDEVYGAFSLTSMIKIINMFKDIFNYIWLDKKIIKAKNIVIKLNIL